MYLYELQALDLDSQGEVAVKIHQLNSAWSEGKKASYVKHAIREYNIHRSLRHPRIVGLQDIFEIDAHTFATVLELCRGGELETHMKEHQVETAALCALLYQQTQSLQMWAGVIHC